MPLKINTLKVLHLPEWNSFTFSSLFLHLLVLVGTPYHPIPGLSDWLVVLMQLLSPYTLYY